MPTPNKDKILHYKILSAIGKGGMGEVFLAQDTKLDRQVAIKFLNEEFSKDADKLKRFVQEAKAASALNHPNILTVHEIGESEGTNYIVTEFIEGKTLRESLLPKQTLSLNQILKISVQVAEALSAAHQAGIIHRDIKPENIMIRQDGYAKVLDFGLVKLSEKKQKDVILSEDTTKGLVKTNPGILMGTVSYMSPEQARGKETDARTDIWSLGVVLYEMLSGKLPFEGETVNHTIVSIIEKEPKLLENVPDELQRIVRKTLTKDADMRYQTARDLLIDLKNLRRDLDIQGELERSIVPNREVSEETKREAETKVTQNVTTSSSLEYAVTQAKSHKVATAIIGIILLGAISAIAYFGFFSKSNAKQIESIAVMPFVNESGNADVEYLSDGMTETLINSLSQIPNLSVKARSSVFRYKGKETNPQTIGKELNVQAILNGRVVQRGDQLTLNLELIDAQTENTLWGNKYERKASDLVSLQSEIARDVSSKLKTKLSGTDEAKVTKNYTADAEANQLYLKGLFYRKKGTSEAVKKALEFFQQAIIRDPNHALAYTGMADSYLWLGGYSAIPLAEAMPKARAAVDRALQIDESLLEAHKTLSHIYDQQWQWAEAEQEIKRAISLNPNYSEAYLLLGNYLFYYRKFDEALKELKRAQELDPLSASISSMVTVAYLYKNDLDSAIEESKKTIELNPSYPSAHDNLGGIYLKQRRDAEATTEFQKYVELSGRISSSLRDLGYCYAVTGRRAEALQILKELEARYAKREAFGAHIAGVYAGLGDKDSAFAWLEKDFQQRTPALPNITYLSNFDDLRNDPRYKDLLKRMGLPE